MSIETYQLVKNEGFLTYEFISEGGKGSIKKVVMFQKLDEQNPWYNLAFGDWDVGISNIDDKIISNNRDTQKILNTVAYAVKDFMKDHRNALLFVEGSCSARTRLYQMNILRNWEDISKYYHVEGYHNNSWGPFSKGINYKAFLLENK